MIQTLDNEDIIYKNLSERDIKRVQRYRTAGQIPLFQFGAKDPESSGKVGGDTPFAIMRADKMKHVDDCNREVDMKLRKAIKKLVEDNK